MTKPCKFCGTTASTEIDGVPSCQKCKAYALKCKDCGLPVSHKLPIEDVGILCRKCEKESFLFCSHCKRHMHKSSARNATKGRIICYRCAQNEFYLCPVCGLLDDDPSTALRENKCAFCFTAENLELMYLYGLPVSSTHAQYHSGNGAYEYSERNNGDHYCNCRQCVNDFGYYRDINGNPAPPPQGIHNINAVFGQYVSLA